MNLPLLAGLALAAISLYFSATGLVSLFAGAGAAIIVMAVAFEMAKVSMTVWLIRNFRLRFLPLALSFALVCLTGISSLGIYGFLGAAYNEGRASAVTGQGAVAVLTDEVKTLETERATLYQQIDATPASHSTNRRRILEKVQPQIIRADSILTVKREELGRLRRQQVTTENDIGELRHAADLFGTTQDGLAKLVITVLAFLLDPLAVLLLLASGVKGKQVAEKSDPLTDLLTSLVGRDKAEELAPVDRLHDFGYRGTYEPQQCTREQPHDRPCNEIAMDNTPLDPIRLKDFGYRGTDTGRFPSTRNEANTPRSEGEPDPRSAERGAPSLSHPHLSLGLNRALDAVQNGATVTRRRRT